MDYPHPPLPLLRNNDVLREVTDQDSLTADYTQEAITFIEKNQAKPFFLYLPHSMVHGPLAAGKAWRGKTGKSLYEDSVAEIDDSVGQILATLQRLNLDTNTLVIFLSDNGGTPRANNQPLRGNKGSTWEGGMRVPALAWWPGHVPKARTSDAIVSNMDILPTFAKLAGATLPANRKIDGQELSALLTGGTKIGSPYAAFYFYHANQLKAVRRGPWKLHSSGELYDLAADISEAKDVATQHPQVVRELQAKLAEARADMGDGSHAGPNVRPAGKAKGPLRFWISRHPESGFPPQAPVKAVPGAPVL